MPFFLFARFGEPMHAPFWLIVLILRAAEPGPDLGLDRKLLTDAGWQVDGPGLIAFFKAHTPTADDQRRLTLALRLLGSEDFAEREQASRTLVTGGRRALPLLRNVLADADLEVAYRAARCVEAIEQTPFGLHTMAATRLLVAARPPGALAALLDVVPWVDDEASLERVFEALVTLGLEKGQAHPLVLAAATDPDPVKRGGAAFVLGQGDGSCRRLAARLLADADPRVRFQAASVLLPGGERTAVPVLFGLLTDGPQSLAWQAEELLYRLAGNAPPNLSVGTWDETGRLARRQGWEQWWKDHAETVDFGRAVRDGSLLGLTVVAILDGAQAGPDGTGRVSECASDGKPRWQLDSLGAIDARPVAGNRVLVAEHGRRRVTERDHAGTIVWEQTLTRDPVSVQRLPNGNTFIGTYEEALEVTPDHTVVFRHRVANCMLYNAVKQRDGHVLLVQSNNTIVELDSKGTEILRVPVMNTSGWASAEKLTNGHFLVALYSSRKVVEVDAQGKELWAVTVNSPGHATRLRNGNTLVASIEGRRVYEFDPAGKEVWSLPVSGRPFHAYRR
jgi:hypothetical protein